MKSRRLWTAAAILGVLILLLFVLSVPRAQEVRELRELTAETAMPVVAWSHTYLKGTYTVTGTVTVPDACAGVAAVARHEGDPENPSAVIVALTMPADIGVCLEIPTKVSFSVAIAGPPDLPITVTVNGAPANAP